MTSNNIYIVGFGEIPRWLQIKIDEKEAVVIYEPNEAVENIIKGITVIKEKSMASVGDAVMLVNGELKVIPAAKAKKYKIMSGGERYGVSRAKLCVW